MAQTINESATFVSIGNKKRPKHRLLLVDDHPVLREGFAQLITIEPDLQVCGQTGNSVKALYDIAALKPDLVVLDTALNGCNGIELIKQIKAVYSDLAILVFSVHDECLYAERALRAGARGYVMKQSPTEEVLGAIRRVLSGERYLSRRMHERMLEKISNGAPVFSAGASGLDFERLSDRELEVFQLIGAGLGTRQIAGQLHLSIKTVETYRAHIKRKMHLRNGMELIRMAMESVHQAH